MAAAPSVVTAAPELESELGDRLALSRRRAGLDQQDMADRIGVSRPLVSKWERGRSIPDVVQAAQWAEIASVSFGWLAGVPAQGRCIALRGSHLATVDGGRKARLVPTLNDMVADVAAQKRRSRLALVR